MPKVHTAGIDFYYQHLKCRSMHQRTAHHVLVYIHGLVMDNLSSGYFTFAHRASAFTDVFLYDLRGHGKSTLSPTGYSLQSQVDDLHHVLKNVEIDQPLHLVGCSFGGALALAYAQRYPQQIKSLILIDAHQNRPEFLVQLRDDLQKEGQARSEMIMQHFQHWLHRDKARKRNRLINRANRLIFQTSLLDDLQQSSLNLSQQIKSRTSFDADPLQHIPILGLYGKESDAYQYMSAFQLRYPHSQITVFDDASHALLWEQTDLVIQSIEQWLAQHT